MKAFVTGLLLAIFARGQATPSIAGRIRIEKTPAGAVRFYPAEVVVWAGGQIHWFNDTSEPHEPGVINRDGAFVGFLDAPLEPQAVSAVFSPLPRIDKATHMIPFTIHFVCGRHRKERGTIQVIPTP